MSNVIWANQLTEFIANPQNQPLRDWFMEPAERLSLIAILEHLRPITAIEIGTERGGSLQILSRFCKKVYAIDKNPSCAMLGKQFSNVEFRIGPSTIILPDLLHSIKQNPAEDLSFVLIDGDHSTQGAKADIENTIVHVPTKSMLILIHDSFMPSARIGIMTANWHQSPHVHLVEVDFIPGILLNNALCGGMAMATMIATPRQGDLKVSAHYQNIYEKLSRV